MPIPNWGISPEKVNVLRNYDRRRDNTHYNAAVSSFVEFFLSVMNYNVDEVPRDRNPGLFDNCHGVEEIDIDELEEAITEILLERESRRNDTLKHFVKTILTDYNLNAQTEAVNDFVDLLSRAGFKEADYIQVKETIRDKYELETGQRRGGGENDPNVGNKRKR